MIVCSCNVISDHDIEQALIAIMDLPTPPIPTPGVVFRQIGSKMNCCGCAPLTVEIIYTKMADLERRGLVCPKHGKRMRGKLLHLAPRNIISSHAIQDLPLAV